MGGEGANDSTGASIGLDGGNDGPSCAGATSCEKEGVQCGPIGDGCGGILQCGDCTLPDTCGGGDKAGVCGHFSCTPKTCAELGANCGPVSDGCGNVLQCGTCSNGETCGGGGTASVCGSGSSCTPKSCAAQAVNCGPVGDGCGNVLQCGTCSGNQTCGGGGIPNVCGAPPCVPKTCAQLNACGPVGDGCGNLLQCGTCSLPQTCGGQVPSQCGIPASCTNLCLKQVTCSSPSVTTTVTGTVFAPNGTDPLLNALVYVPNAAVQAFPAGVSCDQCGAPASGSPLVSATTGVDGKFTLKNVPVGTNIPLVIQLGRWRRQVTIPSVASCTNTAVAASLTRLPKNKTEGDIPLMAFSTGAVDALECVMRKIGVDDSEFTAPSGTGRIHLYQGLTDKNSTYHTSNVWASGGAVAPGGSPLEDQLWTTQAALNKYDMVLFPCQADEASPGLRSAAVHQNLVNYANAGGRIFATHFSYIWLYQTAPFSSTTQWHVVQGTPVNQTGYINTTFPKGQALAQWLVNVNASTVYGEIPIVQIRHDYDAVIAPSQSWMSINNPSASVHYTFNTPVGSPAAQQCGRVLFDDFHVENTSFAPTVGAMFPTECAAGAMTPQEKLLEFMIFDLGSCVTPDIPTCKAKTCAELGIGCGPAGDGCGGVIQCGSCTLPATCGGGGQPSQCGVPTCDARTCQEQGIQCGPAGDGCGNLIQCGACPQGQTCGGGGQPGVCGNLTCMPKTCGQLGIQCGPAGDGCGNLIQCGDCTAPQTCGGGGQPGVCGSQTCKPKTCAELGANCGPVGDGCGNVIQCGTCAAPQTCGGGGVASVCGGSGPQ
ncbi:Tryptophan synthase alpha chain [Minicystis rosea]|nr:Tryptophan synthase alpha chain [Minicystis rosea]